MARVKAPLLAALLVLCISAVLATQSAHVRIKVHDHRHHQKTRSFGAPSTLNLPLLRLGDQDDGAFSDEVTRIECPVDGDPLAAATEPALTTACPLNCDTDSICIYYPQNYTDRCADTVLRSCYQGDTCGFQCILNAASDRSWLVTLYNDDSIVDEVNAENMKYSDKLTVAINASLVTSWIGPAPNNTDMVIFTGNEPANNYEAPAQPQIVAQMKYVPPSGIVPFELPMTAFDNLVNVQYMRVENLRFDAASTAMKKKMALPWLGSLTLTNTQLDYFPLEKDGFPMLTVLDLSVNNLRAIEPDALPSDLSHLNLSSNAITHIKTGDLSKSLNTLDLTGNPISEILPHTLPSSLQILLLQHNKLVSIPTDIAKMKDLDTLYLDGNKIGSVPDEAIPTTALQRLSLWNCSLTRVPSVVERMESLGLLDLAYNDLGAKADFSFLPISLTALVLDSTNLQQPPTALERLTMLSYLSLQRIPHAVTNLGFVPPSVTLLYVPLAVSDRKGMIVHNSDDAEI